MIDPDEREHLIERTLSAHRAVAPDGSLRFHPAWHDLDEAGRAEAFERLALARKLEAGLDPEGLSTTARAVLQRIETGG